MTDFQHKDYFERLQQKWARQSMTKHVDVMAARGKGRARLVMRYTSKPRMMFLMERMQKQIATGDAGWIGSLNSVLEMMHSGLEKSMEQSHPKPLKHEAHFDSSAHGTHDIEDTHGGSHNLPQPHEHTKTFEIGDKPGQMRQKFEHTPSGSSQHVSPYHPHIDQTKPDISTLHEKKGIDYMRGEVKDWYKQQTESSSASPASSVGAWHAEQKKRSQAPANSAPDFSHFDQHVATEGKMDRSRHLHTLVKEIGSGNDNARDNHFHEIATKLSDPDNHQFHNHFIDHVTQLTGLHRDIATHVLDMGRMPRTVAQVISPAQDLMIRLAAMQYGAGERQHSPAAQSAWVGHMKQQLEPSIARGEQVHGGIRTYLHGHLTRLLKDVIERQAQLVMENGLTKFRAM